eukprot:1611919-Amphidinium_carterae.1
MTCTIWSAHAMAATKIFARIAPALDSDKWFVPQPINNNVKVSSAFALSTGMRSQSLFNQSHRLCPVAQTLRPRSHPLGHVLANRQTNQPAT